MTTTPTSATVVRADAAVYHHAHPPEDVPSGAEEFHAPPRPWGALATACATLFLIAVNTTAINTAVGAIADDLSASATTLGWALNAYLLAVAAFVVLGGELDRSLATVGTSPVEEEKLDQVLTGSPTAVEDTLDDLRGRQRTAFVRGAQTGTADGFGAAMLVIAGSSAAGALGWIWLFSPTRGRAIREGTPAD